MNERPRISRTCYWLWRVPKHTLHGRRAWSFPFPLRTRSLPLLRSRVHLPPAKQGTPSPGGEAEGITFVLGAIWLKARCVLRVSKSVFQTTLWANLRISQSIPPPHLFLKLFASVGIFLEDFWGKEDHQVPGREWLFNLCVAYKRPKHSVYCEPCWMKCPPLGGLGLTHRCQAGQHCELFMKPTHRRLRKMLLAVHKPRDPEKMVPDPIFGKLCPIFKALRVFDFSQDSKMALSLSPPFLAHSSCSNNSRPSFLPPPFMQWKIDHFLLCNLWIFLETENSYF